MHKIDVNRPPGCREDDLAPCKDFTFTALRNELCVGGVYVRVFIKSSDTSDIDDPSVFCRDLLVFIWSFLGTDLAKPRKVVSLEHQEYTIEALRGLAAGHDYIPFDIAKHRNGIEAVFTLLERPPESQAFASTTQLLTTLCSNAEFVPLAVKNSPPAIWRLLRALCCAGGPAISSLWAAAEALSSHPEGLESLLACGSGE